MMRDAQWAHDHARCQSPEVLLPHPARRTSCALQVDVKDCMAALDEAVNEGYVDPARVALCGGSHGGFLAGHLAGQHADRFKAAVLRNPVLDISLMSRVRLCYAADCKTLLLAVSPVRCFRNLLRGAPQSHVSRASFR
jgi:acetyl esterase/lipase